MVIPGADCWAARNRTAWRCSTASLQRRRHTQHQVAASGELAQDTVWLLWLSKSYLEPPSAALLLLLLLRSLRLFKEAALLLRKSWLCQAAGPRVLLLSSDRLGEITACAQALAVTAGLQSSTNNNLACAYRAIGRPWLALRHLQCARSQEMEAAQQLDELLLRTRSAEGGGGGGGGGESVSRSQLAVRREMVGTLLNLAALHSQLGGGGRRGRARAHMNIDTTRRCAGERGALLHLQEAWALLGPPPPLPPAATVPSSGSRDDVDQGGGERQPAHHQEVLRSEMCEGGRRRQHARAASGPAAAAAKTTEHELRAVVIRGFINLGMVPPHLMDISQQQELVA
jgi:hypothetical protein